MNRNKKLFCLLVGLFCVLGLTGCKHEHEFATEWSKDANNHWHAAVCEHTEEKADLAAHTWNAGEVTTPATHTADGVKTFTCTVCGQTKTEKIAKDAENHNWGEGVITTQPTHTEQGVKTFTCACGQTKTEPVAAIGHDTVTEWTKDATNHWHACSCGAKLDEAAHVWGEGEITTQPTFDAKGVRTFTCLCGATKTEDVDQLKGTVAVATGIVGGKVEVSKTEANKGDEIVVTPTANKGYTLDKILVNGEELAAQENVYKFNLATATATVGATFTKNVATQAKEIYNFAGKKAADLLDDGWTVMKYDNGWKTTSATLQVGSDYTGSACGTMDAWDNGNVFGYSLPYSLNEFGYTHFSFTAKGNGITTLKVKFTHTAEDQYKGIYITYTVGTMPEGWYEYNISPTGDGWTVNGQAGVTMAQAMALAGISETTDIFTFFDEVSFVISGTTQNGAKCYNQISNLHFDLEAGGTSKSLILYDLPANGKYVSVGPTLQMTNAQMTEAILSMGTTTLPVQVSVNLTNNVVTLKDKSTETAGAVLTIKGKFVNGGDVTVTALEGAMAEKYAALVGVLFFAESKAANFEFNYDALAEQDYKNASWSWRKYGSSNWTEWVNLATYSNTLMRIRTKAVEGNENNRVVNMSCGYSTTYQYAFNCEGKTANTISAAFGNYYTGAQDIKIKIKIVATDGTEQYVIGDASNYVTLPANTSAGLIYAQTKTFSTCAVKEVIFTVLSAKGDGAFLYMDDFSVKFVPQTA